MRPSRRAFLAATTAAASFTAAPPATAAGHDRHRELRTGFENLQASAYAPLRGQRVGIVTNPTGVTRDVRHIVDVMHADPRIELTAVFGPEHGFRGTAQAGGSEGRYDDPATGLPVYDTYLKSGQPLADVSPRRASTRSSSTSRTSAPASTRTSGRCTTAWRRPGSRASGSSCWTGPTR